VQQRISARHDDPQKGNVMTTSRRRATPAIETPTMRIFFAGASGVIGSRLVPLLIEAGHTVGAMTRSAEKAGRLAAIGTQPIVCDVFDRSALKSAVRSFSPDLVLYELTDLPDDLENLPEVSLLNARIRVEGTRNLLDAVEGMDQTKIVAQSVAWTMRAGAEADAVASLEEAVLAANGVVLR
jgi:nucleoside-diphosphate-sugar epimerase